MVVRSGFLIDEDIVLLLFVLSDSPLAASHMVVARVGSIKYPLLWFLYGLLD